MTEIPRQMHRPHMPIAASQLSKAVTPDALKTVVLGRIAALGRAHQLLSEARWEGADLRKIVEEEMAPYHTIHRERVVTKGPAVVLLPATAQAVALALHDFGKRKGGAEPGTAS